MRKVDLTGQRFGKLAVLHEEGRNKHGQCQWRCQCDCGNFTLADSSNLRTGHTTSCGCNVNPDMKERFDSKILKDQAGCWIWQGQLNRCGVGLFYLRGKTIKAKYAAWELHKGVLPGNSYLSPVCGKNECVNPDHQKIISKNPRERFAVYIKKVESGCWEWQGARGRKEYGRYLLNGEMMLAHRASWIIYNGPIPQGLFVCHKCDNPPCVNPDHLFLGTNQDNVDDMVSKGRQKKSLTIEQARELRARYDDGASVRALAREYGIDRCVIRNAVKGVTYREAENEN